jgi:hypothetical protein
MFSLRESESRTNMTAVSIIRILDTQPTSSPTKREKPKPRRLRRKEAKEAAKRMIRNGVQQAIAAEVANFNAK